MKITGMYNKRRVFILIDSGSTQSYLDEGIAQELQCRLESTPPWVITVANVEMTISRTKCRKFKWLSQGHTFGADLRLLPLGGCDIILRHD